MTTLAASYDDTLSRIRLSSTGLSGSAVTARFEWSVDAIAWSTVRGGATVAVTGFAAALDHYEFSPQVVNRYRVIELDSTGTTLATTTISTGAPMDRVWLKVPSAPYCNRPITLAGWSKIERTARAGLFAVAGRAEPIAVSDLHSSRRVTVNLRADDETETAALDLVLRLGLPILLHVPPSCALGSWHATVGNFGWDRPVPRSEVGRFEVALTECAPPDVSLPGYTVTWATVANRYATWADVAAAHATWASVMTLQGSAIDALAGT